MRGQALVSLYPSVFQACSQNQAPYDRLSLVDAIRVGRAREQELAMEELKKRINKDSYAQKKVESLAGGSRGLG